MEIIEGKDLFILGRNWIKIAGVIVSNPTKEKINKDSEIEGKNYN